MTDKKKIVRIINVADYSSSLLQWAQIAQLVEQRTRVTGSIPVLGINPYKYYLAVFVRVFYVQLLPVTANNFLSAEINSDCRTETEYTHDAKVVEDGTFLKYN